MASAETGTLRMILLALIFASCIAVLGSLVMAVSMSSFGLPADVGSIERRADPVPSGRKPLSGRRPPEPAVYVVESPRRTPFRPDPIPPRLTRGDARVVELLDRQELRVYSHTSCSHIGNRDTNLSNLLAALVATLRLPLAALRQFVVSVTQGDLLGFLFIGCGLLLLIVTVPTVVLWSVWARHDSAIRTRHGGHDTRGAQYAFFIAPAAGCWSAKRSCAAEFLADADAVLLTRDPGTGSRAGQG